MTKEIKPSSLTEHKHYITAGTILVGVYITRSDSSTETRYFHHDHLGSLTLITNASGGQIERLAYEGFGKRRYPAGTDDSNNGVFGINTDRGFTGHEHLDEIALIHMNGRVYDPVLARFITPDPNVQTPTDLQSYNRFSYVNNNPLAYYDPTGYFSFSLGPIHVSFSNSDLRTVAAIAAAVVLGPEGAGALVTESATVSATAAAAANAAIAGFTAGLIQAGTVQGGLQGAFSAELFYGAGNLGFAAGSPGAVIAHAGAGCVASSSMGGDCGSGAIAAGFTEAALGGRNFGSREATVIVRAVVGGTAAALGGGKFANGAVTASFGYLFNHIAHAWMGTAAERGLFKYLDARDPGMWETQVSVPGGGRVDLLYAREDVFESKSMSVQYDAGEYRDAAAQVDRYIAASGWQRGDADTIFRGQPSLTVSGTTWLGTTHQYMFYPDQLGRNTGLVFYTRDNSNWLQQIERAFAIQRGRSLTPGAVPWFRLPILP